jgi:hypothetical protein
MLAFMGFWVYRSWGFGMTMNGTRGHKPPSLESIELKDTEMPEICEAFGHEFRCVSVFPSCILPFPTPISFVFSFEMPFTNFYHKRNCFSRKPTHYCTPERATELQQSI